MRRETMKGNDVANLLGPIDRAGLAVRCVGRLRLGKEVKQVVKSGWTEGPTAGGKGKS